MSTKAAPRFPYDHLEVLGFRKLRRYVPPKTPASGDPQGAAQGYADHVPPVPPGGPSSRGASKT